MILYLYRFYKYINKHTQALICKCIHVYTYDIYSHIYRHMYNLHIFKFAPSGAKEMSTKSLKQGVKEVRLLIPLKLKNYKEACQRKVAPLIY